MRYRAVFPAYALKTTFGLPQRLLAGQLNAATLPKDMSALVLVKTIGAADEPLIERAVSRGVPVIYDQCDNVFAKLDLETHQSIEYFKQVSGSLAAIVTPTPELARCYLEGGGGVPVYTVPDMAIEIDVELEALRNIRTSLRRYHRIWPLPSHSWSKPVPHRQQPHAPVPGKKRLFWFGMARSAHGVSGLELMSGLVDQLNRAAAAVPFQLHVLSDDGTVAARELRNAEFEWQFERWSMSGSHQAMQSADLAVLPTGDDEFSRTKSNNRALYALSNNIPVVCNPHASNDKIEDALFVARHREDWAGEITTALTDLDAVRDKLRIARDTVPIHFGLKAIARNWAEVFSKAKATIPQAVERKAGT